MSDHNFYLHDAVHILRSNGTGEHADACAWAVQEIERLRAALEKIAGGFWSAGVVDAIIAKDWHPAVIESQLIARAVLERKG